jgi:hypothetical protein
MHDLPGIDEAYLLCLRQQLLWLGGSTDLHNCRTRRSLVVLREVRGLHRPRCYCDVYEAELFVHKYRSQCFSHRDQRGFWEWLGQTPRLM